MNDSVKSIFKITQKIGFYSSVFNTFGSMYKGLEFLTKVIKKKR